MRGIREGGARNHDSQVDKAHNLGSKAAGIRAQPYSNGWLVDRLLLCSSGQPGGEVRWKDDHASSTRFPGMILPRLRNNLDLMPSPVAGRPGLLMRDSLQYANSTLVIPPPLLPALACFDGLRTDLDLEAELARALGTEDLKGAATHLIEALSTAGFLEDDTYAALKQSRHRAFADSPVRKAAYAGSAYPAEVDELGAQMRRYLDGGAPPLRQLIGIAAPHVSPEGGWQSYRAAYQTLTPELRDRTFVVLGTSHYGQPGKFGLTRKPFETPFGQTSVDDQLVKELEVQPAALAEDYCHAVEHSIEFQVVFLQAIFGPQVRVVPVLCGSFGISIRDRGFPEADHGVASFLAALAAIAEREKERLFWILGVDMAHMGKRYGDQFAARADHSEMMGVRQRDQERIERMNAADTLGFWNLVKENGDDLKWCGSAPLYTFMKAVPGARGTLHRYEQWNIDDQSVVTFAGISFTR